MASIFECNEIMLGPDITLSDDERKSIMDAASNKEEIQRQEGIKQATLKVSENTDEMRLDLKRIIEYQSNHISLLEEQLRQLENIFASCEDSVIVQKMIVKILEENQSLKSELGNISKDVLVQLFILGIQALPILVK